ncbi:hypothetical protein DENSPDRAFT_741693, partial [Dentipellis sp. KUC8613]
MANYLPMLLVSVTTNAVPDDTSLSTQPRGQVDYLSHEWREEDVWRSWRNMTRQKNEIANGARLENASWRTWWKQRNKLKTISPETLNWCVLKDSDVTWLYGPLHTAVDWTPPPKPDDSSNNKDYTFGPHTPSPPSPSPADESTPHAPWKKPILKHRSISDLLTSALPSLTHTGAEDAYLEDDDDEADAYEDELSGTQTEHDDKDKGRRPPLLQTKSDTNVARWARGHGHPFRKDSPPRIIAPVSFAPAPPALDQRSGSSDTAGSRSSQDLVGHVNGNGNGGKKKHISFNTYVEQCIAIESP